LYLPLNGASGAFRPFTVQKKKDREGQGSIDLVNELDLSIHPFRWSQTHLFSGRTYDIGVSVTKTPRRPISLVVLWFGVTSSLPAEVKGYALCDPYSKLQPRSRTRLRLLSVHVLFAIQGLLVSQKKGLLAVAYGPHHQKTAYVYANLRHQFYIVPAWDTV
jgi:hypothetical protein